MRELAVIIPFKGETPKSRLSGVLSPAERANLSYMMLEDVLNAVVEAGMISSCYVVSSDRIALALAEKVEAKTIKEEKSTGVDAAVRLGIEFSKTGRPMIIPADIPSISASEIREALSLDSENADVVLSPSRAFDGTNLLLFSEENPVELSYDRDSFWNHLRAAARRSAKVAVYTGRGVILDIDTDEDLRTLAELEINIPSADFARKVFRNRPRSRELQNRQD
jgi:2-phospho-L-lactate guanylyltransferase